MDTTELKALAAHLGEALLPQVEALVKSAVDARVPELLRPVADKVIDTVAAEAGTAFGLNSPGIGGAPPEAGVGEVTRDEFTALAAKVDALVQATGHGNSAAMAGHL